MSDNQWGRRPFTAGIDNSGTFPVEYRFSHARNGNRRLFVIFANYAAPGDYGWSNGVFDQLRANVLWIRDQFNGRRSYYLCREMDFALEESVHAVITNVMRALDLTPADVTLWGTSKGGSAALHYGLKHGFGSVVSVVPQFAIGSYVRRLHPDTARFMMGEEVTQEKVRALDAVLPDVVRAKAHPDTNIYLLTSPQDEQYKEQVKPYLGLFHGYENFNFICSDSPHISDHTVVSRRNLPTLMGIANLLADGIAPRLGSAYTGFEQLDQDTSGINAFLTATSLVQESVPAPEVRTPTTARGGEPVRFTGTAPGAARVSLWENGAFLASPPVAADDSWICEPDRPWTPGRHTVRLFAVDPAGYQSERTEVSFTVLDAAPAGHFVPAA